MERPSVYFRSGYRRIKRFFAWFPILWHDEDWEPEHLFKIIRFKISRMRKRMDREKIIVHYKKYVRQMKVAEELLERFEGCDFYYTLCEELEGNEKAGKCNCPERTFTTVPCVYDINTRQPKLYRHVDLSCEYCKMARRRWWDRDESKQKADFEFLFKHMHKHVKSWWD